MRGVSCFFAGVFICELDDYYVDEKKKSSFAVGTLFLIIAFRILAHCHYGGIWSNEKQGQLILILLEFPLIIIAAIHIVWLRKFLEFGVLRTLGSLSMDIYLWHIPVQVAIKIIDRLFSLNLNYGSVIVWVFYIITVLLAAILSHRIAYERIHLLKFGTIGVACALAISGFIGLTGMKLFNLYVADMTYSNNNPIVAMEPNCVVEEWLQVKNTVSIEKIQFYAITWNKPFTQEQTLNVDLVDTESGEIAIHSERAMLSIEDGRVCEIILPEPVMVESGEYALRFTSNTQSDGETMALMLTDDIRTIGSTCFVNGSETKQHICAAIQARGG